MKWLQSIWRDTSGDALVEAAILFPIIIMIFAGLVILSMYLPVRASLQRATQYTATALATETSDTWWRHNDSSLEYKTDSIVGNVYTSLFQPILPGANERAHTIISKIESNSLVKLPGKLNSDDVSCVVVNYIIYQEIVVTATRRIPVPVDLSLVRFPKELKITVTSVAVVQNAEEFVRNVDIIVDVLGYFKLDVKKIGELFSSVRKVFG